MENIFEFRPIIKSPFYQTLLATAIDLEPELKSEIQYIKLPDGDLLTVHNSCPKDWKEEKGIVFMLHGFCGSHRVAYMKRIARRLYKQGYLVVRMNWRGCGSGKGLARKYYHTSGSSDVLEVLKDFKVRFPHAPSVLVGFSLGGNAALMLAGELGEEASDLIRGVVAVCPPMDLDACARRFALSENRFYKNYFLSLIVKDLEYLHRRFIDLAPYHLPKDVTFRGIFERYVAPRAGYRDSLEYFEECSAKKVITDIAIPAKILIAEDDPIVDTSFIDTIELPKNLSIHKTQYGGHLAFLGRNQFRWMDHFVIEGVNGILS